MVCASYLKETQEFEKNIGVIPYTEKDWEEFDEVRKFFNKYYNIYQETVVEEKRKKRWFSLIK